MKKGIRDHFYKVSSDFKPFWQVTIFHIRLPHKPNHGLGLRQGRNSENLQKWVWLLKTIFFMKKRIGDHFYKVSSDFKPFWQVTIFHIRLPTNQIMDWDLDKGEILKTYKNEFECLKTIFVMKKGIRDHFCKVSSAFKPFWQVTIFHTRLPHKPNHGLGLRQGRNSENLQKWVWMAQNDIFHEKRHTRSFLQSFKWFKAILTSYHISHQTSHKPNHGVGLKKGWNSENLQKWFWLAQNDFFHERRHTRSFLQSFKWFKAILTSYHILHQTSPQTKSWIGT